MDIQTLDRYICQIFKAFGPTGLSVAVLKAGEIVYKNAFGYKNAETREPVKTTSLFNIASCTKAFTTAAFGILTEEGKLNWADKVIDHIPEFRLSDPYITRELNLIDMLSHRSGFDTFDGDLLWYQSDYSEAEIIERMRYLPLKFPFRSTFGYQNNMYLVAGEIIRRVSGMSWSEFISKKVFEPLEMHLSRPSYEDVLPDDDLALPHFKGKRREVVFRTTGKASGAIFSNVEEMTRWTAMLLNKGESNGRKILTPDTVEELLTPRIISPPRKTIKDRGIEFSTYALGWKIFDYHGRKVAEHGGLMPGYLALTTLVPEENLAVIVFNNGEEFYANGAITSTVLDLALTGESKDWKRILLEARERAQQEENEKTDTRREKRKKDTSPSLPLSGYTGMFEDKSYGIAEVKLTTDELHLTFIPARETFTSKMEHWHLNTFKVDFRDEFLTFGLVTFDFNSSGEPVAFHIDLPSNDFHFDELRFVKK